MKDIRNLNVGSLLANIPTIDDDDWGVGSRGRWAIASPPFLTELAIVCLFVSCVLLVLAVEGGGVVFENWGGEECKRRPPYPVCPSLFLRSTLCSLS